ncbi:ribonuclease T2 family protein [Salipiger mucosus]|uniref:Ribonuclease T2 family protein n=1 Tax=Salipiger mucosus DSM 16094 TaxID=1123237 RepID=S9QIX5_9RHOB|nr:ribonuclease T2 [Salipiger mucosus]EPX79518.1 Ribonuclease T2 family protein [Salipiger mucosus DSM 16094]
MRWLIPLLLALALSPATSRAEGEPAGEFDYYVMALSWSPTWCALEGDARDSPQCERSHGWILHGLWPQYHRGWPSECRGAPPPPSRAMTAAMADIMGTAGLAWYQWRKHGTCAGLPAEDYFALARRAYGAIQRPAIFRKLKDPVTLPAAVVEEAFLEANPGLAPDMVTVTCRAGRIEETRLCLSKTLEPVPCGRDVVRDCSLTEALLDPVR